MPLSAIIVGAGIGGLTAAIALRRAGFHVLILERRPASTATGYAIDVPPNATRVLKHLGMDLRKLRGCRQRGLHVFKADREPMVFLSTEDRDSPDECPFLSVHRVDYHEALKELALGESGEGRKAELRCNCKVKKYDAEKGMVTLEGGEELTAELIVAADGNKSYAHEWVVGETLLPQPTGLTNVRFVVSRETLLQTPGVKHLVDKATDAMCLYVDGIGNFVAHYPCRDGELHQFGIYHSEKPGARDGEVEKSNKLMARETVQYMNNTIASLADFVEESDTYLWQIVDRDPLEKIRKGKLILVGDASHPMQPKMGQGAAQAVEDAAVLGVLLNDIKTSSEIDSRLELWEKLRYPRASAVQMMSRTFPGDTAWSTSKDEQKAKELFKDKAMPSTRAEMTKWALTFDAVAEARSALSTESRG